MCLVRLALLALLHSWDTLPFFIFLSVNFSLLLYSLQQGYAFLCFHQLVALESILLSGILFLHVLSVAMGSLKLLYDPDTVWFSVELSTALWIHVPDSTSMRVCIIFPMLCIILPLLCVLVKVWTCLLVIYFMFSYSRLLSVFGYICLCKVLCSCDQWFNGLLPKSYVLDSIA